MVRDTSLLAFGELRRKPECLNARRAQVFQALVVLSEQFGGGSDLEVSKLVGLPINSVTPRRGELVRQGWVFRKGLKQQHGRSVIAWACTGLVGVEDGR